jgi:hypothetical protein
MRKIAILIVFLCSYTNVLGQDKKLTKTGQVTFEASVPAFEEVKAVHKNVTCVLNTKTGEIQSLILIKGFKFKIALMEEHFNENYMESDKFPKAIFRGKIDNFDVNKITDNTQDTTISGKMELHGKIKDMTIIAKIKKVKDSIELISAFIMNPDDFDVKIPSLVSKKVSKKVNVKLNFILQ